MPIIVGFSGQFSVDGHTEELIAVSYVNLSSLCRCVDLNANQHPGPKRPSPLKNYPG